MKKNSLNSWELALKILSRHSQTEHRLKDKLAQKGVPQSQIEEIIAKAKRFNFVNDKSYAQNLIEKNQAKGKDKSSTAAKLLSHGIPRELVKELLPYVELPTSDDS